MRSSTTGRASWWRYRLWLLGGAVAYFVASGRSHHAADEVACVWALAGAGLLITWLRRRGPTLAADLAVGFGSLWRRPAIAALLALWIVALAVAALPRHLHAHSIGTALVIAAAAGTLLWFARRHPRLLLALVAFVGLTNCLSARHGNH